jgi:hypothetical protein
MRERSADFYIIEELCLTCRVPEAVAPTLIGFHDDADAGKSHCYLKKQPSNAREVELAVKAVELCCCGAYGYRGTDPAVRRKLGL